MGNCFIKLESQSVFLEKNMALHVISQNTRPQKPLFSTHKTERKNIIGHDELSGVD